MLQSLEEAKEGLKKAEERHEELVLIEYQNPHRKTGMPLKKVLRD